MGCIMSCMKIMKENRDSIYWKTQFEDNNSEGSSDLDETSPKLFSSKTQDERYFKMQRTKDEDWKTIFEIYEKYISIIVKR